MVPHATGFIIYMHYIVGCKSVGGRCYYVSDTPVNWDHAALYCQQIGGYLVEISNVDEHAFINDYLSSIGKFCEDGFSSVNWMQ